MLVNRYTTQPKPPHHLLKRSQSQPPIYSKKEFIGSGANSQVFKVLVDNTWMALKEISLSKDTRTTEESIRKEHKIQHELSRTYLPQEGHPQIIGSEFIPACYPVLDKSGPAHTYGILMALLEGKNSTPAHAFSEHIDKKFSEKEPFNMVPFQIQFLKDLVDTVHHCHTHPIHKIMHRDIKPENFVVHYDQKLNRWAIKLIDFGIAEEITGDTIHRHDGSPRYIAPEIFKGVGHTEKADIWALGCVIFFYLSHNKPIIKHHENIKELTQIMIKLNDETISTTLDTHLPEHPLTPLLKNMLKINPDERFSILQVKITLYNFLDTI